MMGLFAWEREEERDAMAVVLVAPKGRKGMKDAHANSPGKASEKEKQK